VDDTELGYLHGVTSPIQAQLDAIPTAASDGAAGGVQVSDGSGGFVADATKFFYDIADKILGIKSGAADRGGLRLWGSGGASQKFLEMFRGSDDYPVGSIGIENGTGIVFDMNEGFGGVLFRCGGFSVARADGTFIVRYVPAAAWSDITDSIFLQVGGNYQNLVITGRTRPPRLQIDGDCVQISNLAAQFDIPPPTAMLEVLPSQSSKVVQRSVGKSDHSADLHRWERGSTIVARINKDGYHVVKKAAAIPDADLEPSEMALWLDDTPGGAKLMIKAKDSAGTVVTGSVPLA
jgi:hypothetical protein